MTAREQFEVARKDALELVDEQPVEAICAMTWALGRLLGWPLPEVADALGRLQEAAGVEGLRSWIEGLP